MSTEIRKKYELKARADSQRETRDRIAREAAWLHEENGVAATTVAEIARRAGVSRLTVYNHFPDLTALLPACAAHFESRHPFPDLSSALSGDDQAQRLGRVLGLLYPWWRETASLWSKVLSDRIVVPEVDDFLSNGIDARLDELATQLVASRGRGRAGAKRRLALVRLSLDFWTWRRLSLDGLDDRTAAQMMAAVASSA